MEKIKPYSFSTVLDIAYEEAISLVTEKLKQEGFGVLTEIDVKSTLKKKLNQDFRKYTILGACNPPFAFRSLEADLSVGLLLPCNVIVYETDDGKTVVSAINPISALEIIKNKTLSEIAAEVSQKLHKVIATVQSLCSKDTS